jgi:hypothetical protein
MVAHDGITADIDREDSSKLLRTLPDSSKLRRDIAAIRQQLLYPERI